jgi:hypothetical protein
MKIEDNQIKSVEPFGIMDGKQVNLVKLVGGLNLATTLDAKGQENVLGAASHQAILCYTIEQRYPSFQPMLMKSEGIKLNAESHSHFLSDDLRKSGHDIYSIRDQGVVDFYITKQNIKVASAQGVVVGDVMLIKSLDSSQEFVPCLSGAVSEKALGMGLKGMKVR